MSTGVSLLRTAQSLLTGRTISSWRNTLIKLTHYDKTKKRAHDSQHARIQEFRQGGGGGGGGAGQSHKKSSANVFFLFFLVLSLFYRIQMVNFKENYLFSRFQRGSNIFQGGSNFFQGVSNCSFPIETHITCDFPGGPDPLPPPPPSL